MEAEKIRILNEVCGECAVNFLIDDDGMIRLTLEVYPRVIQQCFAPQEVAQLHSTVFRDILCFKITEMEDAIRGG